MGAGSRHRPHRAPPDAGRQPVASNGSLWSAPDLPGRIEVVRARGGKLVVVDPRRSRTAEEADEHLFIRPGTDAPFAFAFAFAFALVHVLFDDGLVTFGACEGLLNGLDEVRAAAQAFAPEVVAPVRGIDAATIPRTAREPAGAHVPGGAMVTTPVAGGATTSRTPGTGRGVTLGKYRSRVSGLPGAFGELPMIALAEARCRKGDLAPARASVASGGC